MDFAARDFSESTQRALCHLFDITKEKAEWGWEEEVVGGVVILSASGCQVGWLFYAALCGTQVPIGKHTPPLSLSLGEKFSLSEEKCLLESLSIKQRLGHTRDSIHWPVFSIIYKESFGRTNMEIIIERRNRDVTSFFSRVCAFTVKRELF